MTRWKVRPFNQFVCMSLCALTVIILLIHNLNINAELSHQRPAGLSVDRVLVRKALPSSSNSVKSIKSTDGGKTADKVKSKVPPKQWTEEEVMKSHNDTWKIPRIIHLTWKTSQLPGWTKDYVSKWRSVNPGWQIWFWSDQAAEALIKARYSDSHSMYKGYSGAIQRADAIRYFILHEFGGFYADLDVEPIKTLDPVRAQRACLLSTEPNAHARFCYKEKDVLALLNDRVACNAVMACRRKHAFFKYVIDMLPMVRSEKNPLLSTGPMMLTYRYIAFNYVIEKVIGKSPHRVLEKQNEVFLAPDDWFMPAYDKMQEKHLMKECKKSVLTPNQKQVCDLIGRKDYVNGPRESSLTNHHWEHSWIKGAVKHTDSSTYDISDIVPDVIFPEKVLKL